MNEGEPYWVAMVEEETNRQNNGRQVAAWSLSRGYPDQDQARRAAWELAHGHSPRHPMSPQSRTVVSHGQDDYTVVVHGAVSAFHFRVRVGLAHPQGGPYPGAGEPGYDASPY